MLLSGRMFLWQSFSLVGEFFVFICFTLSHYLVPTTYNVFSSHDLGGLITFASGQCWTFVSSLATIHFHAIGCSGKINWIYSTIKILSTESLTPMVT